MAFRPIASAALALICASPVLAAERVVTAGSFERVRIDGPFGVRLTTGASPAIRVSGEREMIERVEARVDGTTLSIRLSSQTWGERPATKGPVPVVTLATPRLTGASISGGALLSVSALKAQSATLAVSGASEISVDAVEADQLAATLVGSGRMTLAGRANRARLTLNGTGAIAAGGLAVDDLSISLDGPGTIAAAARHTARVSSNGRGAVEVAGSPSCTVAAPVPEMVRCGLAR